MGSIRPAVRTVARFGAVLTIALAALLGVLAAESSAQTPEKLLGERSLVLVVLLLVLALALLTWIDLPILDRLSDPHYIRLQSG